MLLSHNADRLFQDFMSAFTLHVGGRCILSMASAAR
jgi:hypothetical protein